MAQRPVAIGQNSDVYTANISSNFTDLYADAHTHPPTARAIADALTESPPTQASVSQAQTTAENAQATADNALTEAEGRQLPVLPGNNITIDADGRTINAVSGGDGTYDHSELDNLDYESSGHTGFASTESVSDAQNAADEAFDIANSASSTANEALDLLAYKEYTLTPGIGISIDRDDPQSPVISATVISGVSSWNDLTDIPDTFPPQISEDAGNAAVAGSDSGVFVPETDTVAGDLISEDADNALALGADKKLFVPTSGDVFASEDNTFTGTNTFDRQVRFNEGITTSTLTTSDTTTFEQGFTSNEEAIFNHDVRFNGGNRIAIDGNDVATVNMLENISVGLPPGGIERGNLAQDVQESLNLADTALQIDDLVEQILELNIQGPPGPQGPIGPQGIDSNAGQFIAIMPDFINGKEIYSFTGQALPPSSQEQLEEEIITIEQVGYVSFQMGSSMFSNTINCISLWKSHEQLPEPNTGIIDLSGEAIGYRFMGMTWSRPVQPNGSAIFPSSSELGQPPIIPANAPVTTAIQSQHLQAVTTWQTITPFPVEPGDRLLVRNGNLHNRSISGETKRIIFYSMKTRELVTPRGIIEAMQRLEDKYLALETKHEQLKLALSGHARHDDVVQGNLIEITTEAFEILDRSLPQLSRQLPRPEKMPNDPALTN